MRKTKNRVRRNFFNSEAKGSVALKTGDFKGRDRGTP